MKFLIKQFSPSSCHSPPPPLTHKYEGLISLWIYKENTLQDWKICFYFTYSPLSSTHLQFCCSNFFIPPRKILLVVLQIGKVKDLSAPLHIPTRTKFSHTPSVCVFLLGWNTLASHMYKQFKQIFRSHRRWGIPWLTEETISFLGTVLHKNGNLIGYTEVTGRVIQTDPSSPSSSS
jgi:hypothetical protein